MAARVIVSVVVGGVTVNAQAASDSAITRATLKNGLRVVIVRNALAPVVTTQINYLVGSNEAPNGFPGMAHALEHMMFRGSPGLSAAQLSSLIAAMGGNFNANTQQIVTQYFFTVPTGDLETALRIEAVRMRDVLACDGINLLNSCEPAAWQTVFHLHMHVIPRYDDDPLRLPGQPLQPAEGELAEVAAELRGA